MKNHQGSSTGNFVCRRCGLNHPANMCPAWNSRCYKCSKFGHYARMCYSRPQQSFSLVLMIKRERDTERMTTFIKKKMCQELPFYDLNNSELAECFAKHLHIHVQYKRVIRYFVEENESETSFRKAICQHLENQIEELEQKSQNDQELLLKNVEIVASIEAEHSKIEDENQQLRQEMQNLQTQFEHSKCDHSDTKDLKNQLQRITSERNSISNHCLDIHAIAFNLKKAYNKVLQEFSHCVTSTIKALAKFPTSQEKTSTAGGVVVVSCASDIIHNIANEI